MSDTKPKLKWRSLPQFTRQPGYKCDVGWAYLEEHLKNWDDRTSGMGGIDLDPDFQREHVWTEAQQIAYVEFILQGGQSGRQILWNAVGWGDNYKGACMLVDGKQRLNAARKFMRGELAVFGGLRFGDFEGRIPYDVSFNFMVGDLATRAEVLKWYLEINAGGTPHTPEEIQKVKDMLAAVKEKRTP